MNVTQKLKFIFGMVKDIVGNEDLHFLLLNTVFLTASYCRVVNPVPNKPWFLRVSSKSLQKTLLEKEKLLVTSNFSFFHSVFYPLGELPAIFSKFKIVICRLSVWKIPKLVIWKRINI